jgi:hypothetical protein
MTQEQSRPWETHTLLMPLSSDLVIRAKKEFLLQPSGQIVAAHAHQESNRPTKKYLLCYLPSLSFLSGQEWEDDFFFPVYQIVCYDGVI